MAGLSLELNSGERTYGYAVSGVPAGTEASGLPFVDSAGNRINCNYCRVMVHYDADSNGDERDHAIVWVEPSGSGHTDFSMTVDPNIAQEYSIDDVAAGNVSGVNGQAVFASLGNNGVSEYKCDNGAIIDSVNVKVEDHPKNPSHAGSITIELVYGNVTAFNTLRQDRYDRGV